MADPPPWLVAFAAFAGGFAVAELTGMRALGGLVLAAGALYCLARIRGARALAVLVLALGLFALSHPLGDAIGAWPAVLVCAATAAAAVRAASA